LLRTACQYLHFAQTEDIWFEICIGREERRSIDYSRRKYCSDFKDEIGQFSLAEGNPYLRGNSKRVAALKKLAFCFTPTAYTKSGGLRS
jgi:hypothetical protein